MKSPYQRSVFLNCPFTLDYNPIFRALLFAVIDCGYVPRCALEAVDAGEYRLEKIQSIIQQCRFGIHDLSNMELDSSTDLPRFNMPFELGIFLGAKRFGYPAQRDKITLIMDRDPYRYQKSISDISGQDIKSHRGEPLVAIKCIRDWLNTSPNKNGNLPGATHITKRYKLYETELPKICSKLRLEVSELEFNDLWETMSDWQSLNSTAS